MASITPLQTRLAALSAESQPEDSVLLRVLVQVLVSVGILSVSVAAIGVAPASILNLLAIPLSAIGGYWSWRSRRRANTAVEFVIAFGMLLALGVFLARLVGGAGDTRLRLAELLIYLQVLHSFDMPRRKDLGYSIVIGLILLGVAGTVSQTLSFAPLLLTFLAIALPVLILDYQSRLGVQSRSYKLREFPKTTISWRRLGGLLLLIVGLGLTIFALLPRFPGYQVRSFPVSDTINFQGEFSGDRILNSGYISEELLNEAGDSSQIQGTSPTDGPGSINSTFYYGFNQRINQNLRGTLIPQLVMRVRSQAPGFWRMLAFDHYTGQGWEISRQDEVEKLSRSRFSYQNALPPAAFKAGSHAVKGRTREVVQTYTIVNDLPNLIPSLYQAKQVYFPTQEIAIDAEGSLRSPVPLAQGITFTVLSRVPYRDRTRLETTSTTYPKWVQTQYLEVPEAIRDRVRMQAEALLAKSPQPLTNPYAQAIYLAQALKQNYTIQPDIPFLAADEDLVEAFLFSYQGGYPDHFSTALTIMLRTLGIPTRLVAGFGTGQYNPFTGYYVVHNTDAYALTEVFFPGFGWFPFDPIPGHELLPLTIRDSQTFGVLRQFWNWVAGWLPSPITGLLTGIFTTLAEVLTHLLAFFSQGVVGIFAAILSGIGLAFLGWLGWLGWQRWQRQSQLQKLPPIERIYQQLLDWLAAQGFPKRSTQTPLEYAQALCQTGQFPQAEQVMVIIQSYLRWRYGHQPEDPETLRHQAIALRNRRP